MLKQRQGGNEGEFCLFGPDSLAEFVFPSEAVDYLLWNLQEALSLTPDLLGDHPQLWTKGSSQPLSGLLHAHTLHRASSSGNITSGILI